MVIIFVDRFSTNVTHLFATTACHFVAAILLHKLTFTVITNSTFNRQRKFLKFTLIVSKKKKKKIIE